METGLHCQSLHYSFPGGPEVLRGVDLELPRGRFLCLLGPNGSGKSTLLRALAGLLRPCRGQVRIGRDSVSDLPPRVRAHRIGFLPQDVQPHFRFRVDETVALGARVAGHGRWFEGGLSPEAAAAVRAALAQVGAEHLADRHLGDLSGGERRRILVASVLAQEPDWLLLDEPAAMLDLHHQAALFRLLQGFADEGLGVLCVTHDFNLAGSFAEELLLFQGGRVRAQGTPAEVLDRQHLEPLYGEHFELLPRAGGGAPAVLPH